MVDIPAQMPRQAPHQATTAEAAVRQWRATHPAYSMPSELPKTTMAGTSVSHHSIDARNFPEFRHLTLDSGERIRIPTNRSPMLEAPEIHTENRKSSTVKQTSGYFRILLPLFTCRYLADAAIDLLYKFGNPYTKNWINQNINKLSGSELSPINTFTKKAYEELTKTFGKSETLGEAVIESADDWSDFAQAVRKKVKFERLHKIDPELCDSAVRELRGCGEFLGTKNQLEDLVAQRIIMEQYKDFKKEHIDPIAKGISQLSAKEENVKQARHSIIGDQINTQSKNYETSLRQLKKNTLYALNRTTFDAFLGLGSLGVTGYYTHRVMNDIKTTFAETVAYENYPKAPNDITFEDIMRSENKIVRDTINDLKLKTVARVGTDLLFFGRMLGYIPGLQGFRQIKFGGIMMGIKGMLLLTETQRRDTSLFKDISEFVDDKLSLDKGLSDEITTSDLLDMYQKYEKDHAPEKRFRSTINNDTTSEAEWQLSHIVFGRMAELINNTYKYKHGIDTNADSVQQIEQDILKTHQNLALPKFWYLLGHDMIDASQPIKTLFLVEVTNFWSAQTARKASARLNAGENFYKVAEDYPVDFERVLGNVDPKLTVISQKAREIDRALIREYLEEHPEIKKDYDELRAQTQPSTTQTNTHAMHAPTKTLINTQDHIANDVPPASQIQDIQYRQPLQEPNLQLGTK